MGCFSHRKPTTTAQVNLGSAEVEAVYRFVYEHALVQLREGIAGDDLRREFHERGPVDPVLLQATSAAEETFAKESRAAALVTGTAQWLQAGVPLGEIQVLLKYWHRVGFWERVQVILKAKIANCRS